MALDGGLLLVAFCLGVLAFTTACVTASVSDPEAQPGGKA